jgi:hypothetical protein
LAEWVKLHILYHSCGSYVLKLENVTPVRRQTNCVEFCNYFLDYN